MKRYLLYFAFLWAVLFSLACGHAHGQITLTRYQLATVSPQIQRYVALYNMKVDERLQQCKDHFRSQLHTSAERRACMGIYAPDSELSQAMTDMVVSYQQSAAGLKQLERSLATVYSYFLDEGFR
jgi:hypothetical protein